MKYNLTYHAVERLQERFPHMCNYYPEMQNWTRKDGLSHLKSCFNDMLSYCEENKSYLNNTSYMVDFYDKYGYDCEYKFMELKQENMLFLLVKQRSENNYTMVTLMPTEYKPMAKNTKYKQHQTKKEKQNSDVQSWHEDVRNQHVVSSSGVSDFIKELEEKNKKEELKQFMNNELFFKLKKGAENETAMFVKKISNTRALFSMTVDNCYYEFMYGQSTSNKTILELTKVEQIPQKRNSLRNG